MSAFRFDYWLTAIIQDEFIVKIWNYFGDICSIANKRTTQVKHVIEIRGKFKNIISNTERKLHNRLRQVQ